MVQPTNFLDTFSQSICSQTFFRRTSKGHNCINHMSAGPGRGYLCPPQIKYMAHHKILNWVSSKHILHDKLSHKFHMFLSFYEFVTVTAYKYIVKSTSFKLKRFEMPKLGFWQGETDYWVWEGAWSSRMHRIVDQTNTNTIKASQMLVAPRISEYFLKF